MNKLLLGIATALLAITTTSVVGQSNQNIDVIPDTPKNEAEDTQSNNPFPFRNNPFGGDGPIRTSCWLNPNNCEKPNLPPASAQEVVQNIQGTQVCFEYDTKKDAQAAYDVYLESGFVLWSQQGLGTEAQPLSVLYYCELKESSVCCDG